MEYYKQAWRSFEVSNAKEQGERIQDFVGHKLGKAWKSALEFKVRLNSRSMFFVLLPFYV